jgi:murein DD-endopeptidase MepM/ murein hydrolase activator NlpD
LRKKEALRPRFGFLIVLLVAVSALGLPARADPEDRLDDIGQRRERIERRQSRLAQEEGRLAATIRRLDARRARIQAHVDSLDAAIARLDDRIAITVAALTQAQKQLGLLATELRNLGRELHDRQALYQNRAVATYIAGPTAAVDSLLSARSFSELIQRAAYYQSALDADVRLIDQIERLQAETEHKQALVEEKRAQISADKAALERDRAKVATARRERAGALKAQRAVISQKRAVLADVRSHQAKLQAIEDRLQQESAKIHALLAQQAAAAAAAAPPPSGISAPPGSGQLLYPANGPITSGFGYRVHPIFGATRLHTGIDIGAPYGAPVWAADDGTVAFVGTMGGYGSIVVIDHGGGLASAYGHLSAFYVGSGQHVARGSAIASVGCTGYCTGPHLHFEVRVNGTPVDPLPYLR